MEKLKLWRKLWRKALRHNFARHKFVCDGSVTNCDGNCDGQNSVTIFCDGQVVTEEVRHKKGSDGICDRQFRHKKGIVTEIVTDRPSQVPSAEMLFGDILWRNPSHSVTNCDGIRHIPSQIVTEVSQSVTICDGKLWRISVTFTNADGIPSQIPSETVKKN